jgi:hypothetical protein
VTRTSQEPLASLLSTSGGHIRPVAEASGTVLRLAAAGVGRDGSGLGRRVYRWVRAVAQPVDQENDHAPRVAGPVIARGHAQARDRTQNIVGVDIGADLAGGDRTLEKRPKGGPEPLVVRILGGPGDAGRLMAARLVCF